MIKGKFITIDGVEGAGKSTHIKFICDYFNKKGINLLLTREPGGTDIGEKIRELLLNPEIKTIDNDTELLLMFAARNEHLKNKILPALNRGEWVLSDRFVDASYAYQGGGRGISDSRIDILSNWTLKDFCPDLTLLLDIPATDSIKRVSAKNKDRIELEQICFFENVRAHYIKRAKQFPDRIKLIDSTKSIEQTKKNIKNILSNYVF
jgi:dTMP kinase